MVGRPGRVPWAAGAYDSSALRSRVLVSSPLGDRSVVPVRACIRKYGAGLADLVSMSRLQTSVWLVGQSRARKFDTYESRRFVRIGHPAIPGQSSVPWLGRFPVPSQDRARPRAQKTEVESHSNHLLFRLQEQGRFLNERVLRVQTVAMSQSSSECPRK